MCCANPNCRKLDLHAADFACALPRASDVKSIAARSTMIAMTTSSSINVNANRLK
jgi:hypothetical protein